MCILEGMLCQVMQYADGVSTWYCPARGDRPVGLRYQAIASTSKIEYIAIFPKILVTSLPSRLSPYSWSFSYSLPRFHQYSRMWNLSVKIGNRDWVDFPSRLIFSFHPSYSYLCTYTCIYPHMKFLDAENFGAIPVQNKIGSNAEGKARDRSLEEKWMMSVYLSI